MFSSFLIKYAEIGIKGKNRYLFEDALIRQIKHAISKCDGSFKVSKTPGRIFLDAESEFDYDEIVNKLTHVFGIWGVCPVVRLDIVSVDELKEEIVKYFDAVYPDKNTTFKVFSRRSNKSYPLDSMELNAELGEALLNAFEADGLKVDVHDPKIT